MIARLNGTAPQPDSWRKRGAAPGVACPTLSSATAPTARMTRPIVSVVIESGLGGGCTVDLAGGGDWVFGMAVRCSLTCGAAGDAGSAPGDGWLGQC